MIRAISILALCLAGPVFADGPFKAFRHRKFQALKEKPAAIVEAGQEVLLLVDKECLDAQRALDKHGRDPLEFLGLRTKHNISAVVKYPALAAEVTAAQPAALLDERIQDAPCVIGAADNPRVHTTVQDPLLDAQPALTAIRHLAGERFFFHPLWGIQQTVTVAVVDTGIQRDHPDLINRIWSDAAGVTGHDFVNDDADPADDSGHGTHVAGILAAARRDGVGIRGVMGEHAKLMAIKTQDQNGDGNMADLVNAIRWGADHGAEVMNLSLASRQQNPALADAIDYAIGKGTFIVVASGNDGEEITAQNFITPVGYAKDRDGLIGVGSIDALTLLRSLFSNFSNVFVEIGAPGSAGAAGILSGVPGGGYRGNSGTSMATPHVSGAAALIKSFFKTHGQSVTHAQVKTLLKDGAKRDSRNGNAFVNGKSLDTELLGRLLFRQVVIDSTGGFDDE